MKWVFFLIIFSSYLASAWQQWFWIPNNDLAPMVMLSNQLLDATSHAVTLVISLIGILALFLGLMRILEDAGFIKRLAQWIYPILKSLFPEIPPAHPALGAMTMNISANMLGLGNAATPFGIRAMQELETLNPKPGTATNAMVLFLAINTSSVTLIPIKVIAIRSSLGSTDPGAIISTTLFATVISTIIAVAITKFLAKLYPDGTVPSQIKDNKNWLNLSSITCIVAIISIVTISIFYGKNLSPWLIPSLIVIIISYGMLKKIDVYASFTNGAKQGFEVAIKIIPYLVAILFAIAMFRASGALDILINLLSKISAPLGLPAEALPMALLRPLSGSASLGVMTEIMNQPDTGPDSYVGHLVSTFMGSTETTFYVLAVYFGAINIRKIRFALAAALFADFASIVAAVIGVKLILW